MKLYKKMFHSSKSAGRTILSVGSLMLMSSASAFAQSETDIAAVLASYTDNTVVATYVKMSDAAIVLDKAVADLKDEATDAKVAKAAELWSQVRAIWEQGESFLFGPAAFTNLDPKLDSWPLDQVQLDAVIANVDAGKLELDESYVRDYLGAALRGFHAVEYLLYREGKPRLAKDLTDGQKAYLVAAVRILAEDSITLESWWTGMDALTEEKAKYLEEAEIETSGSYAKEFKNAGKVGSRYESQEEALEEILQGCIDIVDELAEAKIGGPAKSGDPKECESWYSLTSLDDCRNNILSVLNAYEGVDANGKNISSIVAAKSKEADANVKEAIENARKSLNEFSAPLSKSLDNKDALKSAIESCEALSEALTKAMEVVIGKEE